MTAQDLKNSILQLAIQGKLVEQRPEEGTADTLFRQIQAVKQDLNKTGAIKKEKSLPEISEDEVSFEIPRSWKWVRFNSVISLLSGADLTPDKYNAQGNGIPYITGASNIEGDTVIINRWTEYPNNIAHRGDLLLTCKGTVGKTVILSEDSVHIARQIMAITPHVADTKYIQLFVLSQVEYLKSKAKSMIPGIERDNVLQLPFPLPPLAEQRRIVAKIEELLPLVEEYGKAEERLTALNAEFPDKLRKSILQQAIQGKLTERDPSDEPASELLKLIRAEKERLIKEGKIKKEKTFPPITEEEMPFEIPESWRWVRLSEVCNISDGTHQTPHYVEHGVPFISAQNVKPYRFIPEIHRDVSEQDHLEYNKVVAPAMGDILMTRVGAGIGEAAIIDQDFKFSIYVSLTLIKRYGNELNMEYLLHVLNSPQGRKLAEKKTLGKGASQGNLNLIFIREFVLPIPPLAEQQRIVDRVNELLAVCDGLK